VLQCGYAESKRNVLRRILNVLTDGAVRDCWLILALEILLLTELLIYLLICQSVYLLYDFVLNHHTFSVAF